MTSMIKHWSLKALALGAFLVVAGSVAPEAQARHHGYSVTVHGGGYGGGYGITYTSGRYRPYYRDYGYYAPGYYYNAPYSYANPPTYVYDSYRDPWCPDHRAYHVHYYGGRDWDRRYYDNDHHRDHYYRDRDRGHRHRRHGW